MLLTRAPLTLCPEGHGSFDLHVLGLPPAFVLSQDQTLKLTWSILAQTHTSRIVICVTLLDLRGCFRKRPKLNRTPPAHPFRSSLHNVKEHRKSDFSQNWRKTTLPRNDEVTPRLRRRGSNRSHYPRQAPFCRWVTYCKNNNLCVCG